MKKLNTEIRNGILLFISLGLYFIIIDLLGFQDEIILKTANIVLVFYFVNDTIRQNVKTEKADYLSLFGSAVMTSVIGIVLSILGFILYILLVKGQDYLSQLSAPLIGAGNDLSLSQYSFSLFAEGMASSVIVAFILMMYWKKEG
jgi:hypothetical protein